MVQEDADAAFPSGGQGLSEELEKELEAMMDDDNDDDELFPVELRPGADPYHELDGSCEKCLLQCSMRSTCPGFQERWEN